MDKDTTVKLTEERVREIVREELEKIQQQHVLDIERFVRGVK